MIHLSFVCKLFFSYVKCYMTKWKILVWGRVRQSTQSFRIISIARPHTDHVCAGHLMKRVEATPHLLSAGIELDSWRAPQTGLEKSGKEHLNTFPSLVLIPFYDTCSHAHTAHAAFGDVGVVFMRSTFASERKSLSGYRVYSVLDLGVWNIDGLLYKHHYSQVFIVVC